MHNSAKPGYVKEKLYREVMQVVGFFEAWRNVILHLKYISWST